MLTIVSAFALFAAAPGAAAETSPVETAIAEDNRPLVDTSDVDLFYSVYEASNGRPSAHQLQMDYLDKGSAGLKRFAAMRNITGERMAKAIAARPEIYAEARRCVEVLPQVRDRVGSALARFSEIHPEGRFPPVTVSVGRGRPVAVAGPASGINIGLEALCATEFINPDIEDRFVRVMVHEFVHTQQTQALVEKEQFTVLEASVAEGVAEFITELLTGDVAYEYMADLVRGRESEIETAFAADMHNTELSAWIWNSTPEEPADLGYWVGYRIAKSYYERADDKGQAIQTILGVTDAKLFLKQSGWRPEPRKGLATPSVR